MTTQSPASHTIEVLPEEVASKIAAGEVIERPASVVRELVDNAIDAGASQIRIEIMGGGRDLIRVVDDGYGLERDEMPRAFLRHATSKIRTADDLWLIRTLGFRGEALFSVAAVSRTSLLSRCQGSQGGYEISLEGARLLSEGPRGAPYGTVVTVRDLFFNLPARLRFLKSPQAEAAHITSLVQQYALAHPHISFSITNEGRSTLQTPGDGDLRSAAAYVYGREVARALLPVGLEPAGDPEVPDTSGTQDSFSPVRVHGYASPPAHSRSNRQAMHFFINRRAVQSRMLQYAVEEAYHSLLMVGRRPICIVNVTIDPSLLDVNVHPAKAEVKFRDERAVFSAVQRGVRSALQAHVAPPSFGSRSAAGWGLPDVAPSNFDPALPGETGLQAAQGQTEFWDMQDRGGVEPLPAPRPSSLPPLRVVGQVGSTYIIAEGPDGLFLVDQHAAHERVLYEEFGKALRSGSVAVQPLLQPAALDLGPAQRAGIEPVLPLMAELGFTIEPFGDTALIVRAVPAIYAASRRNPGEDLLDILDKVVNGSAAERWREEMAITLACHSAVRAGQVLSLDEMRSLLGKLERCEHPRACAHGRPTMLHLSQLQLEREFGRRT
ncbi:MAG TPA: DNA mismatch repair endonuclease MutL [Chloroflexia bacterium]|nr:DNA mismatch repair endonuclease MutL [Chloroflexia bacterium]